MVLLHDSSDFVFVAQRLALAAMGIGLVVGVAGAVAWDRAFSPVPRKAFHVADPLVLAMALGVLVLVAGLGCALPIRRAIGVSPADLLREE